MEETEAMTDPRTSADLEETIRLQTEALAQYPTDHPDHVQYLSNLSFSLWTRYRIAGARDDLDESIRLDTEALALHPPGHPDRAHSLYLLSAGLLTRYESAGARDDLDESIRLDTEALALRPPGHPDRARSLHSLSAGLWTRYEIAGARDDLDESIRLDTEALALRPPGHPDRAHSLNLLSVGIWARYSIAGARDDLDESIRLDTEALALRPPGHPDHAHSLNSLSVGIWARYSIAGARDDLDESIRLDTEALALRPPGHPDRAHSLNLLSVGIWARYSIAGARDDLDESIRLDTKALVLRPPGYPDRAHYLYSLSVGIWARYEIAGARDDLDETIRLNTEALDLRPPGHPGRAASLHSLSVGIWARCTIANARGDLDNQVFQLLEEGCTDIISPLKDSLKCMQSWVEWASEIRHHSLTVAYKHVIPFLRRYLTIGPTVTHQFDALQTAANLLSVPMDAAAHAIERGDVERAVEMLDEGRSFLWSEMRRFREPLLEPSLVGEDLARDFELTRSELQHLSTIEATHDTVDGKLKVNGGSRATASISYGDLVPRKRKLLEKYDRLLELVRQKPGCEDFLQSPPYSKLQGAAKEGPVVIVNYSKLGCHVIIVYATKSPTVIYLGDASRAKAVYELHLDSLQEAKKNASQASNTLRRKLRPILSNLWDLVASKVVQQLEDSGVPHESRIWWCPTSFLTALPFHAAGRGKHWFVDAYISSYTQTLKALIDSRQPTSPSTAPPRLYPTFLVVTPPDTMLRFAEKEQSVMRELGPFIENLDPSCATRDSIIWHLPSYDWVHFICHGTLSDSRNPFESALILRDGERLTLRDIIKLHLPDGKFAFLAACHSAEQGRDDSVLRDEILHLASAMQFSGFRSVIGTMWEMEDKDGPGIAQQFYKKMLEGEDDVGQRHTRAARALWEVTREMRMGGILSLDSWANFVHIGA